MEYKWRIWLLLLFIFIISSLVCQISPFVSEASLLPSDLKKGIWFVSIWNAEGGNLEKIIARLQYAKVDWVAIKCGNGKYSWLQPGKLLYIWAQNYGGFSAVIKRFHDSGIKVLGWLHN